ncbi:MAG TPA: tyrosine-type recombinase/integrase [Candidatus Nitrosotalea sp.]|nr:tyrosine-type recombinase/integrase [Candidatus Nitrosotalea sp.]
MNGTPPKFRSFLAPVIERYLTLKTALGRRYENEEGMFRSLDAFLVEVNASDLSSELFRQWASQQDRLRSGVRRAWLRNVRNLCLYRQRTEPSCFVPDSADFPLVHQYIRPYIFTDEQVGQLLTAAGTLNIRLGRLRRHVFRLGIVVLYTMGLRRGELLRLRVGDYDPEQRTLFIRPSKFHKTRLLPIADDGVAEIEHYLAARRAYRPDLTTEDAPLLWNGGKVLRTYAGTAFLIVFWRLLKAAGIRKPDGRLPRIHDLRHSFAVNALLRWYREGADVQAKLPLLSTYMGHVSIVSTQYYLPFIEPLAAAASERFAHRYGTLITSAPDGRSS